MRLWIGLAKVRPKPGCKRLGKGKGAFVHICAWAKSRDSFEKRVKRAVSELDCFLDEVDDVELLEARMATGDYSDEIWEMQKTAARQRDDAVFGEFFIWHQRDEN